MADLVAPVITLPAVMSVQKRRARRALLTEHLLRAGVAACDWPAYVGDRAGCIICYWHDLDFVAPLEC